MQHCKSSLFTRKVIYLLVILFFEKPLYEIKARGLELGFNIFR